jgi:hypothetical protein
MPAISQPFAFAGALQLSSDPSLPADPIPFNFSSSFVALSSGVLNITGSGSTSIPFDGVPAAGAKGILVRYDAAQQAGAASVLLTLNSSAENKELTPGSVFVYLNANPAVGITSASIAATAPCQLRFWVLG